jgi:hypothetical protein
MRVVQPWMLKVSMWLMGTVLVLAALLGVAWRSVLAPVCVVALLLLAMLTGCSSTFVSAYDHGAGGSASSPAGAAGSPSGGSAASTLAAASGSPSVGSASSPAAASGSPSGGSVASTLAAASGSPSGGSASSPAGAAGSPSGGAAASTLAAASGSPSGGASSSRPVKAKWPQCLDAGTCGACPSLVLGVSQTCDNLAGCVVSQHCTLTSGCVQPGGFCYPGPASAAWSCECEGAP